MCAGPCTTALTLLEALHNGTLITPAWRRTKVYRSSCRRAVRTTGFELESRGVALPVRAIAARHCRGAPAGVVEVPAARVQFALAGSAIESKPEAREEDRSSSSSRRTIPLAVGAPTCRVPTASGMGLCHLSWRSGMHATP